jgi:hypothetical protein
LVKKSTVDLELTPAWRLPIIIAGSSQKQGRRHQREEKKAKKEWIR